MLNSIPHILSPQLLAILCEMGHSDTIVLGDGNFPGNNIARAKGARFVRADGLGIPALLDAILTVMPLDAYVKTPVMLMDKMERDAKLSIPIWDEYKQIVARHDDRGKDAVGYYERFEFYDQARDAFCVVQTGETSIYANVILQKGVVQAEKHR